MKDGRTHLAHKAEHAVDLETGAVVAVTVQGADQGETTTLSETLTAAAEELEAVADKGYHSNRTLVDRETLDLRTYIAEPDRGRRNWTKHANILTRLLVHVGGFNLGLLLRTIIGVGTPRGLQGRLAALVTLVVARWSRPERRGRDDGTFLGSHGPAFTLHDRLELVSVVVSTGTL